MEQHHHSNALAPYLQQNVTTATKHQSPDTEDWWRLRAKPHVTQNTLIGSVMRCRPVVFGVLAIWMQGLRV